MLPRQKPSSPGQPAWGLWLAKEASADAGLRSERAHALEWLAENAASPAKKALRDALLGDEGLIDAALMVELLLECGANPLENRLGMKGRNALMHAAAAGQAACVGILARHCDAKAIDWNGQTALMIAAQNKNGADCVKAILPLSDAAATDAMGSTAFRLAVESGAWDCVDLLAHAADIEWLPSLVHGAPAGKLPIARALLERHRLAESVKAARAVAVFEPCERRSAEPVAGGPGSAGAACVVRKSSSRL